MCSVKRKSKFEISEILPPCWDFVVFAKKWTKSQILKKVKNRAILAKSVPNKKVWKKSPKWTCMQKMRPQKSAKWLGGLFLYFPILLYNTIWIFKSVSSHWHHTWTVTPGKVIFGHKKCFAMCSNIGYDRFQDPRYFSLKIMRRQNQSKQQNYLFSILKYF